MFCEQRAGRIVNPVSIRNTFPEPPGSPSLPRESELADSVVGILRQGCLSKLQAHGYVCKQ